MHTKNRFNLVDEPWIPIAGHGLASLRDVFANPEFKALGGNPVQKIAMTKLLLAICQTAATPHDDEEWAEMGTSGMASKALAYLEEKRDCFWLYGEQPFLQMPKLYRLVEKRKKEQLAIASKDKEIKEAYANALPSVIGTGQYPDLPSENNTILNQFQISNDLTDAEKALYVVSLMNFSFAGKRIDKDIPAFDISFTGKSVSAKAGPSLGNYVGYLHSFVQAYNLQSTLWANIFTNETVQANFKWNNNLGIPPWEKMPETEICEVAKNLASSYMGRLIAMSRFVYLFENGIYYVEGIQYPSHKDGWREPSISIDENSNPPKMIWLDVNKKPWRELPSVLSFIKSTGSSAFDCEQIRLCFRRNQKVIDRLGIWSGGLKVRASSGDQSVKQDDDFIESCVWLPSNDVIGGGEGGWFPILANEMNLLESLSNRLIYTVKKFYEEQKYKECKQADQAGSYFWQLCEPHFQNLVDACANPTAIPEFRKIFARIVDKCYNTFCPKDTARQLDAWAKCKPNIGWYLRGEDPKAKAPKPPKAEKSTKSKAKIEQQSLELMEGIL